MNTPFQARRLRLLLYKLAVLILFGFASHLIYRLILRYWHILDAYVYTGEFHVLFNLKNLTAGNLPLFTEYFQALGSSGQLLPLALGSLLIQNFWLPFTKPILAPALIGALGPVTGSLVSYFAFILVGLLSFGLGIFLLGDLLPLLRGESWWRSRWPGFGTVEKILLGLVAVPVAPLSGIGILAGFLRLPWLNFCLLLGSGVLVRVLWLLVAPGMFF